MTKEELAIQITRAMYKGCGQFESFNAYKCIKGYFLDLEMADLIGVAGQYDIIVPSQDGS